MKIITFLAQKGGTGKTTSAACVGQALSRMGNRVLFVDIDQQGDLSYILQTQEAGNLTILDVINGNATLQEAATATPYGDIITTDPELNLSAITPKAFRQALDQGGDAWDFCIIDNAPALSTLTIASIYGSDFIVIPAQANRFGIKSVTQLLNTIETVRETEGRAGRVLGIVLTQYNTRTILSKQARQFLRETAENAGTSLFETVTRQCISIQESQAEGIDIYTYAPRSTAAADYRALTAEILERINSAEKGKQYE